MQQSRWLVVIGLLWALIVSQAAELLKAIVGKSLLMSCQLPSRQSPNWFYWQDDEHKVLVHWPHDSTSRPAPEYKDRIEVSKEINSGNISIILHNVIVADDQKWFLGLASEKGSHATKKYCNCTLQGSAPYQDLQLTFNVTSNNVACTARGGFPKSEVRWSAFNTSSDEEVDLPGTGTSHQEDPTLKTFNVRSSVVAQLRELENVTCRIHNPLTGDTTEITRKVPGKVPGKVTEKVPEKVPGSDEGLGPAAKWVIGVAVLAGLAGLAGLVIAAFCIYKKFAENNETPSPSAGDPTLRPLGRNRADGNVKLGKNEVQYRNVQYHELCTNSDASDADEARKKEEIPADKVTE